MPKKGPRPATKTIKRVVAKVSGGVAASESAEAGPSVASSAGSVATPPPAPPEGMLDARSGLLDDDARIDLQTSALKIAWQTIDRIKKLLAGLSDEYIESLPPGQRASTARHLARLSTEAMAMSQKMGVKSSVDDLEILRFIHGAIALAKEKAENHEETGPDNGRPDSGDSEPSS